MTVNLVDLVQPGAVVCGLASDDRDTAITELLDRLVTAGTISNHRRDDLLTRVLERERVVSTGFGRGVAVPHVKHPEVDRIAAAIGISGPGIDFKSLDGQPVYTVVLLV
ncbi:MAG: PTS sugar transporter subunit IIA, partial [Myxococcota bacterium]